MRRSVAASLGGKAAELVTLVLLSTVVPRALGADAFGQFSVPLTIVTLGSLAMTLGGPTVMARYVPAAPAADRLAVAKSIGARLARGRCLQLGGIAVVAAALAIADPSTFPPLDVAIVVAALALNVGATLALQVGLGLGRTGAWSLRYPIQNAVLVVAVLGWRGSAGGTGGTVAILVAGAAGAAFAAVVVVPLLRQPSDPVAVPDGAIRFGAHQAAGAALVQCCHRGGVLVVALLGASAAETGYTALATGIALGVTYAVLQAFTVSLTHVADAEPSEAEAVLRRLAGALLSLLAVGGLVAAVVVDDLVPIVFGDEFVGAVDAFGPAIAVVVLAPLASLAVQSAALRLRPETATIAGAASLLAFLATAALLVPSWGATGATTAALAGVAVGGLTSIRLLPGAIGPRLAAGSFGGAAAVVLLAALA